MSLVKQFPSEYRAWSGMKQRCSNKKLPGWPNYGGRGIRFSSEWEHFAKFLEDMGPKPSPGHSLDRIDNNGPYTKTNCRWATRVEQANNRYHNYLIPDENGVTKTLTEWAATSSIPRTKIFERLFSGWPLKLALEMPPGYRRKSSERVKSLLREVRDPKRALLITRRRARARWKSLGWKEWKIKEKLAWLYPLDGKPRWMSWEG
jgi:hypothetical protein